MSIYVDIAIAIILVFFTLSLVVTALNEALAVLLNLRGRLLLRTVRALVEDDGVLSRMLNTASMRAALRARTGTDSPGPARFPDRLPPLAVADALLAATEGPAAEAVEGTLGGQLARSARAAAADTREALARAYEEAMVQLSVRYKRRQQLLSALIGITLAAAFNVNVLALASALRTDEATRAAFAAYLERVPDAPAGLAMADAAIPTGLPLRGASAASATPGEGESIDLAPFENVAVQIAELDALAAVAGFGWPEAPWVEVSGWEGAQWASAALAWVVAGLASILGAPFWFDLLSRGMRARSQLHSGGTAQAA
jgi:hypothetical protein